MTSFTSEMTTEEIIRARRVVRAGGNLGAVAEALGWRLSEAMVRKRLRKVGIRTHSGARVRRAHAGDETYLPERRA